MNQSKAGSEAVALDVARKIRFLREKQQLSQQALAKSIGLSRNTLSMVERGSTSPTLTTLHKIADGLNVDIGSLFQKVIRPVPVNEKTPRKLDFSASQLSLDQGTYSIDGLISALILRLEPNARCGSLLPLGGEEFIYCLSGQCLLTVDRRSYFLESGDSLRFDGRLPHYCQNPGRETTKALIIFLDMTEG